MELCITTRCISTTNLPKLRPFAAYRTHLPWKFALPLPPNSITRKNPGPVYYNNSSIKSTTSEETSSGADKYVKDEPDAVVTVDEVQSGEKSGFSGFGSGEKSGFGGFGLGSDNASTDDQFQLSDFFDKLNIEVDEKELSGFLSSFSANEEMEGKELLGFLSSLSAKKELDLEDSFSIALLGGGGLAALWLTTAVVGAIDNIPLFPKLMEVVGLGYTVWFSTRYLLFKKNRDELAAKIKEVKQQVLGPKN